MTGTFGVGAKFDAVCQRPRLPAPGSARHRRARRSRIKRPDSGRHRERTRALAEFYVAECVCVCLLFCTIVSVNNMWGNGGHCHCVIVVR